MWREVDKVVLILIWLTRVSSMKCLSCKGKDVIVCLSNTLCRSQQLLHAQRSQLLHDLVSCNWICCTLITEILKGNPMARQFVKVSASWSRKGFVSWLLSNFKSRNWTVSLAGTLVNSHSTSKDTMIWLSWSFSLEILKMKCNEFFTMSTALPLRENEMSSRNADKL